MPRSLSETPRWRALVGFPDIVNEVAARTVAAGVVMMCVTYLITGSGWVLLPLAYGFIARVISGPTLSPLGRAATQLVVPALPFAEKPVAGPPKRFAQAIGATLSVTAVLLHLGGYQAAAAVAIGSITVAATLEAGVGFCLGCTIFGWLIRAGVIPEAVCAACSDLSLRPGFAVSADAAG
jgi:hypothetical protein